MLNPFSILGAKVFAGTSLALLIACAVLWASTSHYKHKAERLTSEIASIHAAQDAAKDAQVAVNHAPAATSAAIAEKSHVDEQAYYQKGRAAGLAYADAHRVPRTCTPGPASVPGTDSPAPEHDGPGDAADMVALSRQDFDTLTGNSLRLAKVQQDSQALIDAGVAIPAVEFGR